MAIVVNADAKVQLMSRVSELMPNGKPAFTTVIQYPPMKAMLKEFGWPNMHKALIMLLRDFCNSFGVVRNMNEDQMIEAAGMLIDECGNFRLEDYVMMFSLAKRGQLSINDGKGIMDRIDLEVIGKIMDAYHAQRHSAGQAAQEAEVKAVDNLLNDKHIEFSPAVLDAMTAWRKDTEDTIAKEREEKQRIRDEEMRKRRDSDNSAFLLLIRSGMDAIISKLESGEPLTPKDKEFYGKNKPVIEAEWARRKNTTT